MHVQALNSKTVNHPFLCQILKPSEAVEKRLSNEDSYSTKTRKKKEFHVTWYFPRVSGFCPYVKKCIILSNHLFVQCYDNVFMLDFIIRTNVTNVSSLTFLKEKSASTMDIPFRQRK